MLWMDNGIQQPKKKHCFIHIRIFTSFTQIVRFFFGFFFKFEIHFFSFSKDLHHESTTKKNNQGFQAYMQQQQKNVGVGVCFFCSQNK